MFNDAPSRFIALVLCALCCLMMNACKLESQSLESQASDTADTKSIAAAHPASVLPQLTQTHIIKPPPSGICPDRSLTLQVLGSGGPIADDRRASSAYLLWHEDQAIAMIDIGGGSFQRFGAAGAALDSLEVIAISHFHTDHSADLPALMKSAYFSERERALVIAGPGNKKLENPTSSDEQQTVQAQYSISTQFPSLHGYLNALFDAKAGVYRYLNGLLTGSDALFELLVAEMDATEGELQKIPLNTDLFQLHSLGVHHGIVPALAFRVEIAGRRIIFSGDQSAFNPAMAEFSQGADVIVAHVAIPQDAGRIAKRLHRRPADWAKLAQQAKAKTLLLSHWMQRSIRSMPTDFTLMQQQFSGDIQIADDLSCLVL